MVFPESSRRQSGVMVVPQLKHAMAMSESSAPADAPLVLVALWPGDWGSLAVSSSDSECFSDSFLITTRLL